MKFLFPKLFEEIRSILVMASIIESCTVLRVELSLQARNIRGKQEVSGD